MRGLWARKLRTVLTGFAVVLGVAFVAGTFVFTDTIDNSFKDLFERAHKGEDVNIEATQAVKQDFGAPPTMPASTLQRVRDLPGVRAAEGDVNADGTLLDPKGKPILSGGPPTIILSASSDKTFQSLEYKTGDAPQDAGQIAIDKATADKYHWRPGDRVTLAGRAPKKTYTGSGIATLGGSNSTGGARSAIPARPEAQRMTGHHGYDDISLAADGGTKPEQLKAAVKRELGGGFNVRTGKEAAAQQAQDLSDALGFIRTALLVFAGVALLVGGFLIFNTFAVTVAQRTREFALLRTLGASRRQILQSVLAETVVVGLVASILGIIGGLALAPGLRALLSEFGLDLGTTGTVLEVRLVIVPLLVAVIATVVSGFVPARRATRVVPVEALREASAPTVGRLRRRRILAAVVVEAIGLAILLLALFGDPGTASTTASLMGLGAVLMIFGVALVAPVLVRPLSSAIGRPLERMQGITGRLARENATRQPQRTAVTASALMIGLALVVFVTIFAAGLKATIDKGLDEQLQAAGIVQHQDGFSPLPNGVVDRLRQVDGITAVSPLRFETGKLAEIKGNQGVTGFDPGTISQVMKTDWNDGAVQRLAALKDDQALVGKNFSEGHKLGVGDELHFTSRQGTQADYRIAGVIDTSVGLIGDVALTNASMEREWKSQDTSFVLFAGAKGADAKELQRKAGAALKEFPTAESMTIDTFKKDQLKQVNTLV